MTYVCIKVCVCHVFVNVTIAYIRKVSRIPLEIDLNMVMDLYMAMGPGDFFKEVASR